MTAAHEDGGAKRLLGLATGVAFGALLQRGRLSRHDAIVGQLRFDDARVGTAMATGVATGALGLHTLVQLGLARTHIKPLKVGGIVGGAVLFGAGLALLGYCPGTGVAAVGEGRKDALAGVLGMLAGAAAFVALSPRLAPVIEAGGDFGKLTVPEAFRRERRALVSPRTRRSAS